VSRFSKKARRRAVKSKFRTKAMLRDAHRRSGPVTISYLPGFEPPPNRRRGPTVEQRTKFPFRATINGKPYVVTRDAIVPTGQV
jgi:hypothetical protein